MVSQILKGVTGPKVAAERMWVGQVHRGGCLGVGNHQGLRVAPAGPCVGTGDPDTLESRWQTGLVCGLPCVESTFFSLSITPPCR